MASCIATEFARTLRELEPPRRALGAVAPVPKWSSYFLSVSGITESPIARPLPPQKFRSFSGGTGRKLRETASLLGFLADFFFWTVRNSDHPDGQNDIHGHHLLTSLERTPSRAFCVWRTESVSPSSHLQKACSDRFDAKARYALRPDWASGKRCLKNFST